MYGKQKGLHCLETNIMVLWLLDYTCIIKILVDYQKSDYCDHNYYPTIQFFEILYKVNHNTEGFYYCNLLT